MARPKTPNAVLRDVPARLSDSEISDAFYGCSDAGIMRGLIEAEIRFIRAGGARDVRTLRGFWYFVVKSALSRAGVLNKQTGEGNPVDWDGTLSAELEDLVSARETTYEELQIIDGSRQRSAATPMTRSVAETQWVGPHYPWVILFTEKDTIWPVVKNVAQLYGVSVVSGGGQPSAACTEHLLKQIVRSQGFKQHFPGTVHLIGISDYDPFGYKIFNAQQEQIRRFFPVDEVETGVTLESDRIGVYPKQIPSDELDVKTYTPKASGLAAWFKETGGVNGRPLGIELDVLPINQVRLMLAQAIEKRISLDPRREDLMQGFVEELAWETLMPEIEARKARLVEAVKASDVWTKIQQTELPASLFKDAAFDGLSAIDPREVFDCADEVREVMKKVKT